MHLPRSGRLAMSLLAGLAVCGLALPVVAQDRPDESEDDAMARTLFETGRAYFERAQYEEASHAFAKAFRLSGRPMLLINQARALEAGGQVQEAIEALEHFEEVASADDPLRGTVTSMLRRFRAAERRTDGDRVDEGEPEGTDREAAAPTGQVQVAPEPVAEADDRAAMRWGGIGALSFAGMSAIVAMGTGISSRRTHRSLEDDCPSDLCPPERQGDIDRGRRLGVVSTVFTFVSVGAAVTGALLLVLGRDGGDSETPSPRVRPTGGPGLAGAGLHVSF